MVLALVAAIVVGCDDGREPPAGAPPAPAAAAARSTYVAVGGGESSGRGLEDPLRTSWPQVLFARSLPLGSVFVNMSDAGATVADALGDQVPLAVEQDPTLVTVWFGAADERDGTPPERFGRDLTVALTSLRDGGSTRVLVALPPEGAPGAAYRAEITAAAQRSGAEVVPVPAPDPQGPDTSDAATVAGQAAIADAFARAVRP